MISWIDLVNGSPDIPSTCVPGPVEICCDGSGKPVLCVGEQAALMRPGSKPCCSGSIIPAVVAAIGRWSKEDVFELIDRLNQKTPIPLKE